MSVISLSDAKRQFFGLDDYKNINYYQFIEDYYSRYLNHHNITSDMEKYKIKLQILCVVGNQNFLLKFIRDFKSNQGSVALELLLNSPHINGDTIRLGISITPLLCALMWNTDTTIIRILYSYGASLSNYNEAGMYPEEHVLHIPYFNHLTCGVTVPSCVELFATRCAKEFINVINEIKCITGETCPPVRWASPLVM